MKKKIRLLQFKLLIILFPFGRTFNIAGDFQPNLKSVITVRTVPSQEIGQPPPVKIDENVNKPLRHFACEQSGNFPDPANCQAYWSCNSRPNGKFNMLRQDCAENHLFSPRYKECVSINDRRCAGDCTVDCANNPNSDVAYVILVKEETTETTTECSTESTIECTTESSTCETTTDSSNSFSCDSEGVFPDPVDCSSFHLCHAKRDANNMFNEIKIACPKDMAFDSGSKKCTKTALINCLMNTRKYQQDPYDFNNFEAKDKFLKKLIARYSRKLYGKRSMPLPKEVIANLLKIFKLKRELLIKEPWLNFNNKEDIFRDDRAYKNQKNNFKCMANGRFPDPSNINSYYLCYPNFDGKSFITMNLRCPRGASFNAETQFCSPPSSARGQSNEKFL